MIKLIATDLDGTLLRDDKTFDVGRLQDLLPQLSSAGMLFVAASGNSYTKLAHYFEGLTDQMAFVAENGALVVVDNQVVVKQTIPRQRWQQVVAALLTSPLMTGQKVLLSGLTGSYALTSADAGYLAKMRFFYPDLQLVADLNAVTDDITKVATHFPPSTVAVGEAFLNRIEGVVATTSGYQSIDVIADGVSKGAALIQLAARLGISTSEIAVFGDNLNDLSMLEAAGYAVAMGNGVEAVQACADKVIGSNNDDAVLTEMERIVNGAKNHV